jgi:hypothetical protein
MEITGLELLTQRAAPALHTHEHPVAGRSIRKLERSLEKSVVLDPGSHFQIGSLPVRAGRHDQITQTPTPESIQISWKAIDHRFLGLTF